MKQLQVLGVMRALLVAGMSVAEEDQGKIRGTGPSEGVSAGAIWHETIRLAGIVCAQGADGRRETRSRGTRDPTAGLCEMRGRKKPQMLVPVVSDQVEASRTRIYTRSECGQKC